MAEAGAVEASRSAHPVRRMPEWFTGPERRWAAAGRSVLHAEDDAARLSASEPPLERASARERWARLQAALDKAGAQASRADLDWQAERSDRRYPSPPALIAFLRALMALASEATVWAASLPPERDHHDQPIAVGWTRRVRCTMGRMSGRARPERHL